MSHAGPATPQHIDDPSIGDPRIGDILAIVADEARIDRARLVLTASIEDLGIPSLDLVQIIFEIESRYDVEIPVVAERSGGEFATIGDLVTHALTAIDGARSIGAARG